MLLWRGTALFTPMDYVYNIKVVKRTGFTDRWEYAVIAASASTAIAKAIRQAKRDSGFKLGWDVEELTKGRSVVA